MKMKAENESRGSMAILNGCINVNVSNGNISRNLLA